jgi:hypothetical protein
MGLAVQQGLGSGIAFAKRTNGRTRGLNGCLRKPKAFCPKLWELPSAHDVDAPF